jgi:hypothetical protein
MIRRNGPKGFLLISQSDHAALAAQIATHWGNTLFPKPSPHDAVIAATECHDAGWSMHDDRPLLNEAKIPAAFYEMPVGSYIRIWVASVSAAAARGGPMAGLLVSWHFTALSQIVPAESSNEGLQNMLHDFAAAQQARRVEYCDALGLSKGCVQYPPAAASERDAEAIYNLWVLRMCDWLSLLLCDDGLPEPLREPPAVPPGCRANPITARWKNRQTLYLDPWPLQVGSLALDISGLRIPGGEYRRDADLLRVFEKAPTETLSFQLSSPQPVVLS